MQLADGYAGAESGSSVQGHSVVADLADFVTKAYLTILGIGAVGAGAYYVGGRQHSDADDASIGAALDSSQAVAQTSVVDQVASGALEIGGWLTMGAVAVYGTNAVMERVKNGWTPADRALHARLEKQLARMKSPKDSS